jgi:hypothetical protein
MSETKAQMHNRIAREAVSVIYRGVNGDEVQAMIIVESVVFGFLSITRSNPKEAVEFLDVMSERIVTRLHDRNVNPAQGGKDA